MKRLFAVILLLSLVLAATGCGGKQESALGPDVSQAPDASPIPDVSPVPVTSENGITENMFAATMEYGRLYLLPFDGGEAVLLADRNTICFDRRGSVLYAAFDDGSVMKADLASGKTVQTLEPGGPYISRIHCIDGGFLAESLSMTESVVYIFRESEGSLVREPRFGEYITPFVTGSKLAYISYEDYLTYFNVWDLDTMALIWQEQAPEGSSLYSFGDELYLCDPGNAVLYRMNTAANLLEPTALKVSETDYSLGYIWNGRALIEGNYANGYQYHIVTDNGRRLVEGPSAEYMTVSDAVDGRVLLKSWKYSQSDKVDTWYDTEQFFVLDMTTGKLTQIEAVGKYSPLFAAGDFPVMDSSTARKPVTADIYTFFCESTGYGGTPPLCSTTHKAWLNIADGGADIALLAAPTKEEQDYLEERNVTVEMKLYGGDGLVFIGNRACGVEDLTLDQVRAVFRGEITNWAQLGGVDHPIRVLYRDDQSGSQRLFEKLLWDGMEVPDLEALGFERLDEMSTIVSECLYDPYSIGYSIMTYLNDVYGKEDLLCFSLEGYAATPENVGKKLYPLSTRGYVVIRSDEPENSPARRLFDWFGSPLSDRILISNGVTPLHEE